MMILYCTTIIYAICTNSNNDNNANNSNTYTSNDNNNYKNDKYDHNHTNNSNYNMNIDIRGVPLAPGEGGGHLPAERAAVPEADQDMYNNDKKQ